MSEATPSQRAADQVYAEMLGEMAVRVDAAAAFMELGLAWPTVRAASGELRGALEMMLFTGLLTHRSLLPQVEASLRALNRKGARRAVVAINPAWWPTAVETHPDRIDFVGDERPWLREEEWDSFHSRTSNVLHARNPFQDVTVSLENSAAWIAELIEKLSGLLTAHTVQVGEDLLLGQVAPPGTSPRCRVNWFKPAG